LPESNETIPDGPDLHPAGTIIEQGEEEDVIPSAN